MIILIARIISFFCLTLHQMIVYFMGILTFSVVGLIALALVLFSDGFQGLFTNPSWLLLMYSIAGGVLAVILFMTTKPGEFLLKSFLIMRKPTLREEEKLLPAIDLVKVAYKKKFGSDLKITPYIVDSPHLNGFALGSSTIGLNRAVVNEADIHEIAAILAHEAAHLHYGDGLFNALSFGSGAHLQIFFNGKNKEDNQNSGESSPFRFLFIPFNIVLFLTMPLLWIVRLLDKISHWKVEYRADAFADELGFHEGLIMFLERLQGLDVRENHGFARARRYTHPPTASRIDVIERKYLKTAGKA